MAWWRKDLVAVGLDVGRGGRCVCVVSMREEITVVCAVLRVCGLAPAHEPAAASEG